MTEDQTIGGASAPKTKRRSRKVVASTLALAIVGTAGAVGASQAFKVKAEGNGKAELSCSGGIVSLGQVLSEGAPIFEGDPPTVIERQAYYLEDDEGNQVLDDVGNPILSYQIETLTTATHTGTHLDAPSHFLGDDYRSVDDFDASEFVWPSYIIDVRDRMRGDETDGFQITEADIKAYEKNNGKIQKGSLVIIQTGLGEFFYERDANGDLALDEDGHLIPGAGYFADAPGFAGDAVQWMIDNRGVKAIGSDTFGPDSSADADFSATYTILVNDGVAIPGLANLDAMSVKGDIVMAAPVKLLDGSAFQVNPLACLGSSNGHGNDNDKGKKDD